MDALSRMEEKVYKRLATSSAMLKLNQKPEDSAEALINKYKSGGDSDVDDEMERLKAELEI